MHPGFSGYFAKQNHSRAVSIKILVFYLAYNGRFTRFRGSIIPTFDGIIPSLIYQTFISGKSCLQMIYLMSLHRQQITDVDSTRDTHQRVSQSHLNVPDSKFPGQTKLLPVRRLVEDLPGEL